MDNELALSALDLVGIRAGESAGGAIARSVDLAQHIEQLGYKRYWLAEHHSIAGLACSATPVLIGHVAAATKTIRVGSGGVMLPNHAPLVVAEQFGTRSRRRLANHAGATQGFAADWGRVSRTARGIARLSGAGKAGPSGESDSGAGKQCADHVAGLERLQRATGGDAGIALCICGALCSRVFVCGGAVVPPAVPSKQGTSQPVSHGRGTGDRGRDRCGLEPAFHDGTAALSATHPKPAGRVAASGGFDGTALERTGARSRREQTRSRDCWIGCDGKGWTGKISR